MMKTDVQITFNVYTKREPVIINAFDITREYINPTPTSACIIPVSINETDGSVTTKHLDLLRTFTSRITTDQLLVVSQEYPSVDNVVEHREDLSESLSYVDKIVTDQLGYCKKIIGRRTLINGHIRKESICYIPSSDLTEKEE